MNKQFKRYLKQASLLDGSHVTWPMIVIDTLTEIKPVLWLTVLAYLALC